MRRHAVILAVGIGLASLAGCVERRFVVTSDPPGAQVLRNGKPIGDAPADDHFVYYGRYHFTLIKPGYETLQVDQKITRPWYQYFPLDLVTEVLWPFAIEDVRHFHYQLQPLQNVRPDDFLRRAESLRDRGKTLGPGNSAPPAPALAAPTPPPAPPMQTAQQP